ncbi:hypothetical protein EDB81DRAFT_594557, partial [Dactylonectria macrodidyma]
DVLYFPGEMPLEIGAYPYCHDTVKSLKNRNKCKHIRRCRRRAVAEQLGILPSTLKYCYFCMDFLRSEEWTEDCRNHLSTPLRQCGSITYRHTLVRPAYCLLCKQSEDLPPDIRMQSWDRDADAVRHMEENHKWPWYCRQCDFMCPSEESGYHHLYDNHGYRVPKARKRK